jgi:uncharacterized protein YeaC (DUF1315 family)
MKLLKLIEPSMLAIITLGAFSPSLTAFAANDDDQTPTALHSATSQPAQSIVVSDKLDAPDEQTISMATVMDEMNLTPEQRNEIIEAVLYQTRHTIQTRSRYYHFTYKISAKHVKKLAKTNKKVISTASGIAGLASLFGVSPSSGKYIAAAAIALYGSYWWQVKTAASHGWGLRVKLTVDSYTPTTAGMKWTVSYVK